MRNRWSESKRKRAKLALEDGLVFEGFSCGANGEKLGEVVFNTSMAGYQEILTDPSYKGQIVAMTYPLIGNYGVNAEDIESRQPFLEGFVVRECSSIASSWRAEERLQDYLGENRIVGIEGIDTRALTRHIRLKGEMKAVISTTTLNDAELVEKAKSSEGLVGRDLVKEVTAEGIQHWNRNGRLKVIVIDCGVKLNILRELERNGCKVTVVPANTGAEKILKMKPDGVLLSNGPGDPEGVPYVVENVRKLITESSSDRNYLPIMGICLGHQMLGLAFGGRTYKLKFGHHGGNHPVKDMKTGKVSITVQNHGFCVDMDSLSKEDMEITHINLNDNTLEGMKHRKLPIFSVQFHPEASPGPHDAQYLFKEFVNLMTRRRNG